MIYRFQTASEKLEITNYGEGANVFVEELIEKARPLIEESLEPVPLPEFVLEIAKKVVLVEVKGEDNFYGQLTISCANSFQFSPIS